MVSGELGHQRVQCVIALLSDSMIYTATDSIKIEFKSCIRRALALVCISAMRDKLQRYVQLLNYIHEIHI
jgi:hypothetical protein